MRTSITRAVNQGVPASSIAFYARWWQFETWLRQLVYLELRAKYGSRWLRHLSHSAISRSAADTVNEYMATPDAANALAYLDILDLFELIAAEEHWPLFEPSLLPRARWDGLVDELRPLRHRSAHCRRPHPDDLSRIEQALRDLEHGARVALEAFNNRSIFTRSMRDPIAEGWVLRKHDDAERLIDHCRTNYDTQLRLEFSVRPWATSPRDGRVAEKEGLLVHASFSVGFGTIEPAKLWREELSHKSRLNRSLIFLVMNSPWEPSFSFAAVDGPQRVNDVIGQAFDALIVSRSRYQLRFEDLDREYQRWRDGAAGTDPRIQLDLSALAQAYPEQPFSVFQAG